MSTIKDENGKTQFDLRVHIRDAKSGFVTKKQPYQLVVDKERGEFFIRNGIRYHRDGSQVKANT